MRKLFISLLVALAVFGVVSASANVALAQYDDDYYSDDYYYDDFDYYDDSSAEEGAAVFAVMMMYFGCFACFYLVIYIYYGVTLMTIAKKLGVENAWLAWIPLANLYLMVKCAGQETWTMILYFIPFVGLVWGIYIWMQVGVKRGFAEWVGILVIVPVVGWLVPAYIAFGEPSPAVATPTATPAAS